MKINFIGNGNITSYNFNASYVLNDHILIDAPAGMYKELNKQNIALDNIDVIFITHLHGDHYFDLPFILFNMYVSKREKNILLIGPKNLKRKLKKLTKLAFPNSYLKVLNNVDITYFDSSLINNTLINDLSVSSVKMIHGPLKNCYGYIFTKDDKKLGFTGDTEYCPGLTYMVGEVNYCVIDVSNKGANHHLPLNDFEDLCKNTKTIYLPTHYPDKIKENLEKITNVKLINSGEQFFI